ncbi:archaetidylserine synthase [Halomicrobium zhouii]|uniref:Archaetidylserine synthase n=1 Tax=Halomicrobium zhouii TaxID=767519 RepID=A0A1I6LU14_9EURY|nr:protein sorting system archaetidylserine synthase [Halomicrobium zhouii]SFS06949.1 archaetidylserine synthase [Halomicrobium zhouii]
MSLQVSRRLGPADGVTLINAVVGFVAGVVAFTDPRLAARLVLLAAIVDALDGIIARSAGNSDVGPLLDSITDIVSFGTTPGLFVYGIVRLEYGALDDLSPLVLAVALLVPAGFAAFSILRTAFYEVYVGEGEDRPGIPNALAAVILAAAYLSGLVPVPVLLGATVVLSVLMVAPVRYPKLAVRDAFALGVIQALAILVPSAFHGVFPIALLVAAMAYLTLGPVYYWGPSNGSVDNAP